MSERLVITGMLQFPDDHAASGITIVALDRDLPSRERIRGPQALGETVSDGEGRFTIEADTAAATDGEARPRSAPDVWFQAFERGQALTVRAVEARGVEVDPDLTIFDVTGRLDVVVHVVRRDGGQSSEYERLTDAMAPVLGDLSAADLSDDDLRFLRRELPGDDSAHLGLLRAASFVSPFSGAAPAAFYGWARLNVPEMWRDMPSFDDADRRDDFLARLLDTLASTDAGRLIESLRVAVADRIIPHEFDDRAEALAHLLRRRRLIPLTVRIQLVTDTAEAIPVASHLVATRDVDADRDLGEDVTDAQGGIEVTYDSDPDDPAAGRSLRLTVSGPELIDQVELIAEVRPPDADSLVATVVRVPWMTKSGNIAAVAADEHLLPLPADTIEELRAAGITTFADVRRAGGTGPIGALAHADPEAVRRLDALADLDRVMPGTAQAAALLSAGYENVIAIADAPWAAFVADMAPDDRPDRLTYEEAIKLRAAAQAQVGYLDLLMVNAAANLANGTAQ